MLYYPLRYCIVMRCNILPSITS